MVADVYQAIFDTTYDIAFRDRLPRFLGKPIKGYIDPATDQIFIRRNLSIRERALTLLHEVIHECYPDWSEPDVEACAVYTYDRLSNQERAIVNFLSTDPVQTAPVGV